MFTGTPWKRLLICKNKILKKIFIDVYTNWCVWCKVMDSRTFEKKEIAQLLNNEYYPVKFNAESRKQIYFQKKWFENKGKSETSPHELAVALLEGQMSYPAVVFIDEKGDLITHVSGYMKPKDFNPVLKYFVSNKYKEMSYNDYLQSIN